MKFGASFITILFTSALLGYFFTTRILGFSSTTGLAASGIVSFLSIVVEALLFVMKDTKAHMARSKKLN